MVGRGASLSHLSSAKVKAKGCSHQKEQKEDTKGEKEREMAFFLGIWDSLRALGTYGERTELGIGSQLK